MTKFLTSVIGGAVMAAFAATADAAPLVDFLVAESSVLGSQSNTFTADRMGGTYSQMVTIAGGKFDIMAYAQFGQFYANDGANLVTTTQLDLPGGGMAGYGMYALFESSGTVNGSAFSGTSGSFKLFIDVEQNTTLTLGATGTTPVAVGGDGDDELIGGGTLLNSVASGSGGAQALAFQFALFNQAYLSAPNPFYPVIRLGADFGNLDSTPGNYPDSGEILANFDAFVSEPTSLSLIGVALLGAGVTRRRRKS